MTDREIIRLYRKWSKDHWSAGFVDPSDQNVQDFVRWLSYKETMDMAYDPLSTRENELVAKVRRHLESQ